MLRQNTKTLIQANQVSVYINNHGSFVETERLHLVKEGYDKLASYIKKLIESVRESADRDKIHGDTGSVVTQNSNNLVAAAYEIATPDQVEMQIHVIQTLLEGIMIQRQKVHR